MTESPRLRQIREWLAECPDDPELQYATAMEYRSLGEDEQATSIFRKLIVAKPDFVPSYLMLAQTLLKLGRNVEALAVLCDGIAAAKRAGQEHALSELQALLDGLET